MNILSKNNLGKESVILNVASTTSLHDTQLEDNPTNSIKAAFKTKYPWITVNFLSQGTGAAIETAKRGDADMILVHDPAQENAFLTSGYGVNRKIFAYNFFVIVGPANDPAKILGVAPEVAMRKISEVSECAGGIIWVSRNDGSGTAAKERILWEKAGLNMESTSKSTSWFKSTGSGMGATLAVANKLNGYVLSDLGTYHAYYGEGAGKIQLKILIHEERDLLNVYSAMVADPRNPRLKNTLFNESMLLLDFLVSDECQNLIANYGKSTYSKSLFNPFIPLVSGTKPNATILNWIQSYAYLPPNTTECPASYRYNAGNLYSHSWDVL